MWRTLRKYLKKSKILELPCHVLTVVLIGCIWVESIKLGASVALVLIVMIGVRYTCVVVRKIRFLQVQNRNTDNLFNRIKK